ncbi:MAG: GspE/PulE/PilB domain-containing protein, partial [Planctomycetota bacterium]
MSTTETGQRVQLGQLLLQQGAINEAQLEQALEHQRSSGKDLLLGEVLQKLELCSEEDVMQALAAGHGVPFAHVSPRITDPKVMESLPREFIEKNGVLPMFHIRDELTLAMSEPSNVFLIEEVTRLTGCKVHVVSATSKDIKATVETHLPAANVFVIDDILEEEDAGDLSVVETKIEDISDLEIAAEGSPVVKLVNYLIYSGVRDGAS